LATPGAILVTEAIARLAEGFFTLKPLGAAQVKGVREPVSIYEVLGVGPLRTRLQVAAHRGLVRFVGRQQELAQLQRAWEQAQAGRGQIVAVVGEPGVGKSRLYYEFKLRVAPHGAVWETFSVSHGRAYPLLPVIELLKQYFECGPHDDVQRRRERVLGEMLALGRALEGTGAYLLALLGDPEATASLASMDAPFKRQRTFEALNRLILWESRHRPLLLVVEDLHWVDSETEAWLQTLSERVATARLLLLVNYRPEYWHAWGSKSYYTQLRLDPLGPAEAEELLSGLIGAGPGLDVLKQRLLAQTEGNPFFLEELVQTLVEQGVLAAGPGGSAAPYTLTRPVPALHIPSTVQGVLAAQRRAAVAVGCLGICASGVALPLPAGSRG